MGKQWQQRLTLFWRGSRTTADGDCSHEIKRCLLLRRNAMTNLDSILESREITLPTTVHPKGNHSWMFIGRTDVAAETPILWPHDEKNWLIWKDPDVGKTWRQKEKGTTEDEMVGWHHWLDRHEFEQALGVSDGQGGLACCSPWGWTWLSNWTDWLTDWVPTGCCCSNC